MTPKRKDSNPTAPFKNALERTTRALAKQQELTLTFSGDTTSLEGGSAKIPQISRKMTSDEILLARGSADSVALKKRYHNRKLHDYYLPKGQLAQELYKSLETARCEIIGTKSLPGTATNLDTKIVHDLKKITQIADIDANDLSMAQAAGYLLRQLATNRQLPRLADNLASKWRDFIYSHAGQTLVEASSSLSNQKSFARISRKIIQDLGYGSELGDDPDAVSEQSEEDNIEDTDEQENETEDQSENQKWGVLLLYEGFLNIEKMPSTLVQP